MEELKNEEITAEGLPPSDDTNQESRPAEPMSETDVAVNYGELVKADIAALSAEFSELSELSDITELENPLRYAALRDLGLTPAEAYLATTKNRRKTDNRSHLFGMPMVSSSPLGSMSERELESARELFSDMSDAQIRKLYKKVTK